MRKTLPLEKPTAELLRKSLKDDGNKHFILVKLLLEINSSFIIRKIRLLFR